jgi:hypothetical protein
MSSYMENENGDFLLNYSQNSTTSGAAQPPARGHRPSLGHQPQPHTPPGWLDVWLDGCCSSARAIMHVEYAAACLCAREHQLTQPSTTQPWLPPPMPTATSRCVVALSLPTSHLASTSTCETAKLPTTARAPAQCPTASRVSESLLARLARCSAHWPLASGH